jgi:nitroimidazol reductase NimA-like FMN-containing flavoprotein (pyridoxamine 5'-phosphate oxidase superfamily)
VKAPPKSVDELTTFRRAFRDVPSAHVATRDADGLPHVVPLWFVWLEDAIYLTCREGTVVHRNLSRGEPTSLSIDRGVHWNEHQGVMIRGRSEVLPEGDTSAKRALSAWFDKYAERLSGDGFATYARDVERPSVVRIRPDRISGWGPAGSA